MGQKKLLVSTENVMGNRGIRNKKSGMRMLLRMLEEHVFLTKNQKVFLALADLTVLHTGNGQTWSQQMQKSAGFNCINPKPALQLKLTLIKVDWALSCIFSSWILNVMGSYSAESLDFPTHLSGL